MRLIYSYITKFRNIKKQEIYFSEEYEVAYNNSELSIQYLGSPTPNQEIHPNPHMRTLHLLAGKTGSGKTNILQLLGMPQNMRLREEEDAAYFLLYADEEKSQDRQYFIEIYNMQVSPFTDNRQQPELSDIPEIFHSYARKLNSMAAFSFLCDESGSVSRIVTDDSAFEYKSTKDKTVIINGFDRNAFLDCPYPNERTQPDEPGSWIMRYTAPYQRTALWYICDYIADYLKEFDPESVKRKAAFVIHWNNWADEIKYSLDERLEKHDYWTFAEKREEEIQSQLERKKKSRKHFSSAKHQFVHDLWTDFAVYLRKWIAYMEQFYMDENRKLAQNWFDDEDVFQEYLDYAYEKEYKDEHIDPTVLPDYKKMSVVKRLMWLAEYIDRKDNGAAHGLVYQIADDIKDIGNILNQFDDKYFTEDTFTLPVCEMYTEKNRGLVEELFERMEQYRPDQMGLFTKELLPYHFTHLSTGEYQYAKVLGGIKEYSLQFSADGEKPEIIYILDEPEVYMHPEMCRRFVSRLNQVLACKPEEEKIQIIISTHSPFMLSDVMAEQVTRLDVNTRGECLIRNGSDKKYFGANIHTIMADGFFLDYTIGEYAREYLQKMLEDLKTLKEIAARREDLPEDAKDKLNRYRQVVSVIGDDMIRKSFELLMREFE